MAAEDNESSGSRAMGSSTPAKHRQDINKVEVFNEVLSRLQQLDIEEKDHPDFEDQLWNHFNRFTPGYVLDVNVERAEDVLMHMRLLRLAEDAGNRPSFNVRLVQVHPSYYGKFSDASSAEALVKDDAQSQFEFPNRRGIHPPPTFGSSSSSHEEAEGVVHPRPMFEITLSTLDKPKVLTEMTSFLSNMGLNIHEAHAYSTGDGFSLDAFVLDGWPNEDTEQLKAAVAKEVSKLEGKTMGDQPSLANDEKQILVKPSTDHVQIPNDGSDVWEIDVSLLKYGERIGSGSFGDLYKGLYCSQEVAIKVLKPECVNNEMLREFAQEVYILRKVRHKNVVQFIGACTKPPNVCILTEFMSKGSLHSFLHEQKGVFNLPSLLKVALDVSKGMDFLHQNNIIHRDLKTGNLLMDENEVVKVSDFGVARVQAHSGVMTAETGTYRWMAPEVIEHKRYNHKADVFSFAVVLWELITGEIPHAGLTPLQAAVGVVQQGLRPTIPLHTHPKLVELLQRCWQQDPNLRPDFSEIVEILQHMIKEVAGNQQKEQSFSGSVSEKENGR